MPIVSAPDSVMSTFEDTPFSRDQETFDLARNRARENLVRQNQQAQLEAALQQQFDAADETASTLRNAGMAAAADRFERGARRQSFNSARRGLLGGSIDLEQRAEQQEQAGMDARNVEQQALQATLQQQARAQQSSDNLLRQVLTADPTQLQANMQQIRGIGDQARAQSQVGAINNQIQQSRNQQQGILGNVIGGALGGAGSGIGAALMRGA